MTSRSQQKTQLVLTNENGRGQILVDMESFFEFSFELAEDLQDLIRTWQHRAAPKDRALPLPKEPLQR